MVTHTRIHALHLPLQVHTQREHTHTTVNTHPEQWAAIYPAAPWEQLEIWCLAQGHLVVVLRVERALYIHSPPDAENDICVLCLRSTRSDRRSAKATANGKRCNISPVHRSPSHPLRREVLWGKRGSPAEGHWDVCSLTYVFWFSINWRENWLPEEGTMRKANLKKPSKTGFCV